MSETLYSFRYNEYWMGRSGLTFNVEKVLFQETSEFQEVAVLQTDAFGNLLTLDGVVMFTQYDEFVYHEMMAHPALALLGDPERVLIIGGGDGGVAREVLRYESVTQLDLVDIDGMVVEVAKRFFPEVSVSLTDPRLNLHIADGIQFVKEVEPNAYDLIVVDSTDPIGISEGLFTRDFYNNCLRALNERGLIAVQSESPFDQNNAHVVKEVRHFFDDLFPVAATYLAFIPTYAMGMWSFTLGSKQLHSLEALGDKALPFADDLRYYTPEVHRAAFALPAFVKRLVQASG